VKQINIALPLDILQALLDSKQTNVPFNTDELGFPLRIVIWRAEAQPRKRKFKAPRRPQPGEDDGL
jgi:hypothetical protein